MEKLRGARENSRRKLCLSDKIIDLQIEEVLIELTVTLNAVNLISVLSMNIINCENRKKTNFVKKAYILLSFLKQVITSQ